MKKVKVKRGDKYGKLTIIRETVKKGVKRSFLVKCECGSSKGKRFAVTLDSLRGGNTSSCGCNRIDHGLSRHPLYKKWNSMVDRCNDPDNHRYGGRGIKVCQEWEEDVSAFIEWAEANGGTPSLYLDRIDNDGNYSPSNCRFINAKESGRNRSDNLRIEFDGVECCLSEHCERLGLSYAAVNMRINRHGWGIERALSTPIRKQRKRS